MREEGKITVFLLDDHEVVRRGVHELLSVEDGIEAVGEAGTAIDALARVPAIRQASISRPSLDLKRPTTTVCDRRRSPVTTGDFL